MEDKLRSHFDGSTTFLLVISLFAFLLIHDYDGGGPLPLLMWAITGLVGAPFAWKIPCFVLLASWLGLWLIAFRPGLQKNGPLVIGFFIPLWIGLIWTYNKYEQYGSIWPVVSTNIWFWIPALVFVISSVLAVNKVFRQQNRQSAV